MSKQKNKIYCVKCKKVHKDSHGWGHIYQKWNTEDGIVEGWGCKTHSTPSYEFVPESIKENRKKYAKDIIQPFRGDEFSKEFATHYPEATNKMIKEGNISKEKVKKAKNVWTDIKSLKRL